MPQRSSLSADAVIEILAVALAAGFVLAGVVVLAIAGSSPTRTGYGAGLMFIVLAGIALVGGGALHQHRKHTDGIARQGEALAKVAEAVAKLQEAFTKLAAAAERRQREEEQARARLERQVREMRCEIRLIMAAVTAQRDQLADRRRA